MIRIFHVHVPAPAILLATLDAALLYLVIDVSVELSRRESSDVLAALADVTTQKLIFILVMLATLFAMGVYSEEAMSRPRDLAVNIGAAVLLAFVGLAVVFYLIPSARIWMSAMLPALVAAPVALTANRAAFLRLSRARLFKTRVLVLGAGERARRVEALERDPAARFVCSGFLAASGACRIDRKRLIQDTDVRRLCDLLRPREIVVALDERRNALPTDALIACRLRGTRVVSLQEFLERETGRIEIEHLDPSWLAFSDGTAKGVASRVAKRTFDLAVSALFLAVALPILVVAALAIWLEDRGPVFYTQERVGLCGRTFRILKFRSMRIDAEKDGRARWASRNDPRVTRVGSFLRRSRIDEAPQMINVLKGDMSFVGPRPERPSIVAEISREIPYYDYRHLVKPGITGWAQIRYAYTDSVDGALEKLKYDLYYAKNGGIFFDGVIILQTVRVVLSGHGSR